MSDPATIVLIIGLSVFTAIIVSYLWPTKAERVARREEAKFRADLRRIGEGQ